MDVDFGFDPNDHDVRVEADGWIYYVRAVKRGEMLAGSGPGDIEGMLGAVPLAAVFGKPVKALRQRLSWKVGVVRIQADRFGAIASGRVVHKESHPAGPVPLTRISELAEEARRGRFAPSS